MRRQLSSNRLPMRDPHGPGRGPTRPTLADAALVGVSPRGWFSWSAVSRPPSASSAGAWSVLAVGGDPLEVLDGLFQHLYRHDRPGSL
jgi:hypothetical protein